MASSDAALGAPISLVTFLDLFLRRAHIKTMNKRRPPPATPPEMAATLAEIADREEAEPSGFDPILEALGTIPWVSGHAHAGFASVADNVWVP